MNESPFVFPIIDEGKFRPYEIKRHKDGTSLRTSLMFWGYKINLITIFTSLFPLFKFSLFF